MLSLLLLVALTVNSYYLSLLQSPSSRDKTPPCEADAAVSGSIQGSLDMSFMEH